MLKKGRSGTRWVFCRNLVRRLDLEHRQAVHHRRIDRGAIGQDAQRHPDRRAHDQGAEQDGRDGYAERALFQERATVRLHLGVRRGFGCRLAARGLGTQGLVGLPTRGVSPALQLDEVGDIGKGAAVLGDLLVSRAKRVGFCVTPSGARRSA